jgi:hypothetical protein
MILQLQNVVAPQQSWYARDIALQWGDMKQKILEYTQVLRSERARCGGPDVMEAFRESHVAAYCGITTPTNHAALQHAIEELVASGYLVVEAEDTFGDGDIYARAGAIGPAELSFA